MEDDHTTANRQLTWSGFNACCDAAEVPAAVQRAAAFGEFVAGGRALPFDGFAVRLVRAFRPADRPSTPPPADGPSVDTIDGCMVWGRNNHGQLGLGHWFGSQRAPALLLGLPQLLPASPVPREVKLASCGASHTVMATTAGELWACCANELGQLGIGETVVSSAIKAHTTRTVGVHHKDNCHFSVPQRVGGVPWAMLHGVRSLACGDNHTVLADGAGRVWLWGDNSKGQFGLGLETPVLWLPELVEDLVAEQVSLVAAGARHSAAVGVDGQLFTWGDNKCLASRPPPPLPFPHPWRMLERALTAWPAAQVRPARAGGLRGSVSGKHGRRSADGAGRGDGLLRRAAHAGGRRAGR
jgi:hypothetical protein